MQIFLEELPAFCLVQEALLGEGISLKSLALRDHRIIGMGEGALAEFRCSRFFHFPDLFKGVGFNAEKTLILK